MTILTFNKSASLRIKFINSFIKTESDYYKKYILEKKMFSDGMCYIGYLWDCLHHSKNISPQESLTFLETKKNIYIMWDIHSKDRIFIPNYWKYPKHSILKVDFWSESYFRDLPEDIYLFDETFSWCIVYTHEEIEDNTRDIRLTLKSEHN